MAVTGSIAVLETLRTKSSAIRRTFPSGYSLAVAMGHGCLDREPDLDARGLETLGSKSLAPELRAAALGLAMWVLALGSRWVRLADPMSLVRSAAAVLLAFRERLRWPLAPQPTTG